MTHMPLNPIHISDVLKAAPIAQAQPVFNVKDTGVKLVRLDGDYPFHSHDVEEAFVILNGELTMDIEGQDSQALAAGDVVKIPANQRHRTRTHVPSDVLLIGPK